MTNASKPEVINVGKTKRRRGTRIPSKEASPSSSQRSPRRKRRRNAALKDAPDTPPSLGRKITIRSKRQAKGAVSSEAQSPHTKSLQAKPLHAKSANVESAHGESADPFAEWDEDGDDLMNMNQVLPDENETETADEDAWDALLRRPLPRAAGNRKCRRPVQEQDDAKIAMASGESKSPSNRNERMLFDDARSASSSGSNMTYFTEENDDFNLEDEEEIVEKARRYREALNKKIDLFHSQRQLIEAEVRQTRESMERALLARMMFYVGGTLPLWTEETAKKNETIIVELPLLLHYGVNIDIGELAHRLWPLESYTKICDEAPVSHATARNRAAALRSEVSKRAETSRKWCLSNGLADESAGNRSSFSLKRDEVRDRLSQKFPEEIAELCHFVELTEADVQEINKVMSVVHPDSSVATTRDDNSAKLNLVGSCVDESRICSSSPRLSDSHRPSKNRRTTHLVIDSGSDHSVQSPTKQTAREEQQATEEWRDVTPSISDSGADIEPPRIRHKLTYSETVEASSDGENNSAGTASVDSKSETASLHENPIVSASTLSMAPQATTAMSPSVLSISPLPRVLESPSVPTVSSSLSMPSLSMTMNPLATESVTSLTSPTVGKFSPPKASPAAVSPPSYESTSEKQDAGLNEKSDKSEKIASRNEKRMARKQTQHHKQFLTRSDFVDQFAELSGSDHDDDDEEEDELDGDALDEDEELRREGFFVDETESLGESKDASRRVQSLRQAQTETADEERFKALFTMEGVKARRRQSYIRDGNIEFDDDDLGEDEREKMRRDREWRRDMSSEGEGEGDGDEDSDAQDSSGSSEMSVRSSAADEEEDDSTERRRHFEDPTLVPRRQSENSRVSTSSRFKKLLGEAETQIFKSTTIMTVFDTHTAKSGKIQSEQSKALNIEELRTLLTSKDDDVC
eukprot:Gregarina_sp_Poly_1__7065@NODE_385_length_9010_cov_42_618808_g314_i0_p1_GENE_NODE_385_length_9010_cov_42_618808_g314_i0NODE_385_length_9010_cov_42_618808_g314_i0_p1_ORF_typecomplete_len1008_score214_43_NODE_385_length_9010_cov_42_618808_g314_i059878752